MTPFVMRDLQFERKNTEGNTIDSEKCLGKPDGPICCAERRPCVLMRGRSPSGRTGNARYSLLPKNDPTLDASDHEDPLERFAHNEYFNRNPFNEDHSIPSYESRSSNRESGSLKGEFLDDGRS